MNEARETVHDTAYPVADVDADVEGRRFTFGLVLAVADVLAAHGFPEASGSDLVRLQGALFGFCYGSAGVPDTAT